MRLETLKEKTIKSMYELDDIIPKEQKEKWEQFLINMTNLIALYEQTILKPSISRELEIVINPSQE